MVEKDKNNGLRSITISDIADELGLSKTTISRAISGKGRIGEDTRKRVLEYIQEHDYRPNLIAKSLAQSKTYNIGVVLPSDANLTDTPFFQRCLMGICEVAASMDYDVVVTTAAEDDITLLKRIINNQKVDGIVLTRALVNDIALKYLEQNGIPFVIIGSVEEDDVVQVDSDHMAGCSELTSFLLMSGNQSIAILAGNQNHIVNQNRYKGYLNAFAKQDFAVDPNLVFLNMNHATLIERAVDQIMDHHADCIVCTDDLICSRALAALNKKNYSVPDDIRIASFYNSAFLESHNPPVTVLDINVKELGVTAGANLINMINGEEVSKKTYVNYEIVMKQSTK